MVRKSHSEHRFGPENQELQQSETGRTTQPPPVDMDKRGHHGEGGPGNQNFRANPRREGLLTDRGPNK